MLEKIKKMYPAGTWVYSASGYRGKPQRVSGHKYKFSNIYLGYIYADDKILLYNADTNEYAEIVKFE